MFGPPRIRGVTNGATTLLLTDRALDLLGNILSEVRFLGDGEMLTDLEDGGQFVEDHAVAVPAIPAYLDALLADTPFMGGMAPKLGVHHLRSVSVLDRRASPRGILTTSVISPFPIVWGYALDRG